MPIPRNLLTTAMARLDQPEHFDISTTNSAVYHRFLAFDHRRRPAIRGQLEGLISFGFNVLEKRPADTLEAAAGNLSAFLIYGRHRWFRRLPCGCVQLASA